MENIRNFCIIAHIDHGKSTLADRMLEITHTVEDRKMKEQLLDQMDLERERGITIKLQPVRMLYKRQATSDKRQPETENASYESPVAGRESSSTFLLNLIDTPGHVDFQYEVSRSLAAVEGAVLLVDATKGVQAQTLANLYSAIEQGLTIIPVVNKIDLPNAEVERTKKEIVHILGCKEEEILCASGKTGLGVREILDRIVTEVPAPKGNPNAPLRALIFDSKYDDYRGVVAYVRIVDGEVRRDEILHYFATGAQGSAIEVGYFFPGLVKTDVLRAGEVGYIATGLKSVSVCRVGDTIYRLQVTAHRVQGTENSHPTSHDLSPVTRNLSPQVEPLPGYREVRPVMYASFYPREGEDYNGMRDALEKLRLNDASFVFEPESNLALGRGFRCGFLGMLHLEIIQARLDREFEFSPVITTPSVVYEVVLKNNTTKHIYSPVEYPDPSTLESIAEPFVKLEVITPSEYMGGVMKLLSSLRSTYKNTQYLDADRAVLEFEAPLMEVIVNFHDDLKSISSGFASMNYEIIGYHITDLVKIDILIAGDLIEAFSRIVPKSQAFAEGKKIVEKLKEVIPKQNFVVALQAAIGGKIIARSSITAYRKDVIAKLYGGDFSRKKKLLEKQKAGKKRMKSSGRVNIPPEAFLNVLKR
jgi:GTP-binding protein LepA